MAKQYKPMIDGTYIETSGDGYGWNIFSWSGGIREHLNGPIDLDCALRLCEARGVTPTVIKTLADKLEVMV